MESGSAGACGEAADRADGDGAGVEISDLCRREGLNPTMYYQWKQQLLGAADRIFEKKDLSPLHTPMPTDSHIRRGTTLRA